MTTARRGAGGGGAGGGGAVVLNRGSSVSSSETWSDLQRVINPTKSLRRPRVAVCVTGMPSRLRPSSLLRHLVDANKHYTFHIFYVLQETAEVYFTTKAPGEKLPQSSSRMGRMPQDKLRDELMKAGGRQAVKVTVLQPTKSRNASQWAAWLGLSDSSLDRITQFTNIQDRVLAEFSHHPRCAASIESQERHDGQRFDYVVRSREDLFFFQPLRIETVWDRYAHCDIVYKGCLSHGGIGQRLQLLKRDRGLAFLATRFSYYRYMNATGRTHLNPEQFEKGQASWLNLTACAATVNEMPAAAARVVANKLCFNVLDAFSVACYKAPCETLYCRAPDDSAAHCFPKDNLSFVNSHLCVACPGQRSVSH